MLLSKNSAGPQVLIKIYLHYSLFSLSNIEIFLRRLHETINSRIMRFDFYLSRVRRDDDILNILRVDNCSEVDIAGDFYKQNGKYFDDCCDLENKNAPECILKGKTENLTWLWNFALVGLILLALLLALVWWCLKRGWSRFKTSFEKYYIACRQCRQRHRPCCERQRPVGNENSTRRFSRRSSTRPNS